MKGYTMYIDKYRYTGDFRGYFQVNLCERPPNEYQLCSRAESSCSAVIYDHKTPRRNRMLLFCRVKGRQPNYYFKA